MQSSENFWSAWSTQQLSDSLGLYIILVSPKGEKGGGVGAEGGMKGLWQHYFIIVHYTSENAHPFRMSNTPPPDLKYHSDGLKMHFFWRQDSFQST